MRQSIAKNDESIKFFKLLVELSLRFDGACNLFKVKKGLKNKSVT